MYRCRHGGFHDADGHGDHSHVSWRLNEIPVWSAAVLWAPLEIGDRLACVVTPFDGLDAGAPVEAHYVTGVPVPTLDAVAISPADPRAGDTLTCQVEGFTAGVGDSDETVLRWRVNGADAGEGPTLGGAFVRDDVVSCHATPFDGVSSGAPV